MSVGTVAFGIERGNVMHKTTFVALVGGVSAFGLLGSASAQSPSTGTATTNAQNTVKNLPGDGAVKGDTQPKPSPVGQSTSDYKPAQKLPSKPVPPPETKPK